MIQKLLFLFLLSWSAVSYSCSSTFADDSCDCPFTDIPPLQTEGPCYQTIACDSTTSSELYSTAPGCDPAASKVRIAGVWYRSNDCSIACDGGAPELPQTWKWLFMFLMGGLALFIARRRSRFT